MIKVTSKGNWSRTHAWLNGLLSGKQYASLAKFGPMGVRALAQATPKETGELASSWTFGVEQSAGKYVMYWTNTDVNDGQQIAILLQYGHGVRGGGFVEGRDYINPAMQPIFDQMVNDMWKVVTG
jgi:hypothetical protein